MAKLGKIVNFSKNKTLIGRVTTPLELKDAVHLLKKDLFTADGAKIGRLQDVFGPVKSPYLSIKPVEMSDKFVGKDMLLKGKK